VNQLVFDPGVVEVEFLPVLIGDVHSGLALVRDRGPKDDVVQRTT